MVFDWNGFYQIATTLKDTPSEAYTDEVRFRNAISRVYYSALHASREFYRDICGKYPPETSGGNSHKDLIECIKTHVEGFFNRDEEISGRLGNITCTLDDCRRLRNEADYEPEPDVNMDEFSVKDAFRQAEKIFSDIEAIRLKYG